MNKVIPDGGLCLCFFDFVEVGDPFVYPSEGSSHQLVKFRLVAFKPFVGEIMTGRVLGCSSEGIRVTLDFFDDVFIPSYSLQVPSEYADKKWVWTYGEEGQAFFIVPGDSIRFRVAGINFSQVVTTARGVKSTTTTSVEENAAAKGPDPRLVRGNAPESAALAAGDAAEPPQPVRRRSCSVDLSLNDDAPPPMKVIGSCNEYGLGLASWWTD